MGKAIVTPKKTTSTTTPKGKTQSKGKGGTPAANPLNALNALLLGSDVAALDEDSPFASDFERFLAGKTLYTGKRPGTNSTHKTPTTMLKGLSQPSKMSDETFRALQEKLYTAGFYGNMKRSDIHWGLRSDQSTREAYAWSLALAVQLDADHGGDSYSYDQMMNERSAMNLGAGEAGGDAFSYQPDDPAKIRRLLDEGLPEVMGRALSPQETDALVAKWQSMALDAAKSGYAAQKSGGVASLPAPDFETFAKSEAERLHPEEVKAKSMATLAEQFLASIQGETKADRVF